MLKRFAHEVILRRLFRQQLPHNLVYPLILPKGLHLPDTQPPNPVPYKTTVLSLNILRYAPHQTRQVEI